MSIILYILTIETLLLFNNLIINEQHIYSEQMSDDLRQWLQAHKLADYQDALVEQGVQDASDMKGLDKSDAIAMAVAIGLHKKMLFWRRFMGAVVGDKEVPIPQALPATQAQSDVQSTLEMEVCMLQH